MKIVIDANIIAGIYKSVVLEIDSDIIGDASIIHERLDCKGGSCMSKDVVYLDEGGHIENEWRKLAKSEWFDIWLGDLFISGAAENITVGTCKDLVKSIRTLGFPTSKDSWYVRTAYTAILHDEPIHLITQDIDFYDPSLKSTTAKNRERTIKNSLGPVSRSLKKNKVYVRCVESYLDEHN